MENKELKKLCFLNRQPTLFRHGCPGMTIIPADNNDDETISLSPLALEPLNADFDGDTVALYICHDEDSLNEMNEKAFLKRYVHYDGSDMMLSTLRHEALYAAYILTNSKIDNNYKNIIVGSLKNLPEEFDLYNNLNFGVELKNNKIYSYGLCLFNKWCGFNEIIIDYPIMKKKTHTVSQILYDYHKDNYYDFLTDLEKKLFFFITCYHKSPTLNINEMLEVLPPDIQKLFQKLPNNHPEIGYYVNKMLVKKCLDKFNHDAQLYNLYKSGSRFSETQLARSVINIGYCANSDNDIVATPVNTNLISGLTEKQFFAGADGTRKGISDNAKSTPDSGYLERSLVMILSPLEVVEDDCFSLDGINTIIMSQEHGETLIGKYFKDPNIDEPWKLFEKEHIKTNINKQIIIRSPITCQTPNFRMCQKCFGEKKFSTKYLGITAGQILAERLTQLTMRTFHESGSANLNEKPDFELFLKNHLIDIQNSDDYIVLEFNTDNFPEMELPHGFNDYYDNKMIFNVLKKPVNNNDSIAILNKIKDLLKIQKNNIGHPQDYYQKMMTLILTVGKPYSSFVEMLFANMFIVEDYPNMRFWRYNTSEPIIEKFGDKTMAKKLSGLLGFLFQPNVDTIEKLDSLETMEVNDDMSIYEKIFLENS